VHGCRGQGQYREHDDDNRECAFPQVRPPGRNDIRVGLNRA
jgi:hypothetical protein